jgi:HEPN domain-containing protein
MKALWRLRCAQEDLVAADKLLADRSVARRHSCRLAQQAAEKVLKPILVFIQKEFPRTHDLDEIRKMIPSDWAVVAEFPDLAGLTEWAVEGRYPGDWPDATAEDAQNAVHTAHAICAAVIRDMTERGLPLVAPPCGSDPAA